MKIVIISFHFAEYATRLARALACEHQVLLFLDSKNATQELVDGVPKTTDNLIIRLVNPCRFYDPRILSNSFKIVQDIKRFNPDVIHCQEAPRDYLWIAWLTLRHFPWILTVHDPIPHSGRDRKQRRRIAYYRDTMRRHADGIIVHGENLRNETVQLFGTTRDRVWAVAHGILGGDAINRYARDWEPGNILFFGRVERYKGLSILLKAFSILQQRGVTLKLVIAGMGSDLDNHRDEIATLSDIELHERYIDATEVGTFFGRANIVVLPYTDATQSGVAALAMQAGRPVVASNVGSVGEVVRHGYNGLLVEPNNPATLADALVALATDEEKSLIFARNARITADSELSWPKIAQRTMEIYRALVIRQRPIA